MNGWRAGEFFLLCWLLAVAQDQAWAKDGSVNRPPTELAPLADPAGISTGNRSIDALLGQSPEAAAAASRAAARPRPAPLRMAEAAASAPAPESSLRDALLREAALNAPSRTPEREAADPATAKPAEAGAQPARGERAAGSDALPEGLLAHLAALVTVLRNHRDSLLVTAAIVAVLAVIFSVSRGSGRQSARPPARSRPSAPTDRRRGPDRRIGHRGTSASNASTSGSERRRA